MRVLTGHQHRYGTPFTQEACNPANSIECRRVWAREASVQEVSLAHLNVDDSMLEACETAAKRSAKNVDAARTTHIRRLWLTMQPARKKYSASSTCAQAGGLPQTIRMLVPGLAVSKVL